MANKDLPHKNAVSKLKELAEGIDFAMLATALEAQPLHIIPMSTKRVDDEGNLWFLSGADSQHNRNITANENVHLIYAHPGDMQFLNIYGKAAIITDKTICKELYGSGDDAWFDGVDDPNLTAIRVAPIDAFYWDPKSNNLVNMLKIGVGAVTGKEPDLMEYGELKIDVKGN